MPETNELTRRMRVIDVWPPERFGYSRVILAEESDATDRVCLTVTAADFTRVDLRPVPGMVVDLTWRITTDGAWADGSGRIVDFALIGAGNVEHTEQTAL